MSERKGLQKYFPPDYDPSKTSKGKKKGPKKPETVRMMTPFSFQCNKCGGFITKSTKFNARKHNTSETYLGQKIVQLSLRCAYCSFEIVLKTDPKNSDYVIDSGAKRVFDPTRDREAENETDEQRLDRLIREQKEEEERKERERLYGKDLQNEEGPMEGEDPMKHLESKMNQAKKEMAMQQEVDDLRAKNARLESATQEGILNRAYAGQNHEQESKDAEVAEKAFRRDTNGHIIRTAAPLKAPSTVDIGKIVKSTKRPRMNGLGIKRKKV